MIIMEIQGRYSSRKFKLAKTEDAPALLNILSGLIEIEYDHKTKGHVLAESPIDFPVTVSVVCGDIVERVVVPPPEPQAPEVG